MRSGDRMHEDDGGKEFVAEIVDVERCEPCCDAEIDKSCEEFGEFVL